MAWAYFDTSALVKRYVHEVGHREVLQLLRRHDCVTSAIAPVELRSALRRRTAERELDPEQVPDILKRFAVDREFWAFLEVTSSVLTAAETLVAQNPLRTLDAIHVASAQLLSVRLGSTPMMFVSADTRQSDVAASLRMTVRRIGPA